MKAHYDQSAYLNSIPLMGSNVVRPKMELSNLHLWESFHRLTNEMVVNKAGRKMFPKIELKFIGLNPTANYFIILRMRLVDDNRYKFQGGRWSSAGHDNVAQYSNSLSHHECANSIGEYFMRNTISFDRVKLTNRPQCGGNTIMLNSMHKYQPEIHLYDCSGDKTPICVLDLPVLQFMAVTAYQNQAIIELKIEHNPFAKGFREGSARKRSLSYSPDSIDSSTNSSNSPPPFKPLKISDKPMMNGAYSFLPPTSSAALQASLSLAGITSGQQQNIQPTFHNNNTIFNEYAQSMLLPQYYHHQFNGFNQFAYPASYMFGAQQQQNAQHNNTMFQNFTINQNGVAAMNGNAATTPTSNKTGANFASPMAAAAPFVLASMFAGGQAPFPRLPFLSTTTFANETPSSISTNQTSESPTENSDAENTSDNSEIKDEKQDNEIKTSSNNINNKWSFRGNKI